MTISLGSRLLSGGDAEIHFCDNNQIRLVVVKSATASLRYQSGVIEGTITSQSVVNGLSNRTSPDRLEPGQIFGELSETTSERHTRQ